MRPARNGCQSTKVGHPRSGRARGAESRVRAIGLDHETIKQAREDDVVAQLFGNLTTPGFGSVVELVILKWVPAIGVV